jgi:two-component system LytT family sensor kinase
MFKKATDCLQTENACSSQYFCIRFTIAYFSFMKNDWYRNKWVVAGFHILFWIFFITLPYFLRPPHDRHGQAVQEALNINFEIHRLINALSWIAIFYINTHLLIPAFLFKKKYGYYLTFLVLCLVALFIVHSISAMIFLKSPGVQVRQFFIFSLFPCIFIVAVSLAYKMFVDQLETERKLKERETENLRTELIFLRSQISPHFIFNVLNNMVALARKKSDDLEPSLIKLSSLLRYMLYEADQSNVSLQREIEYLQNYIDLQKQRFRKNAEIRFSFEEPAEPLMIEPMLLVPFVENAFKHGTTLVENGIIDISLKVKDGVLDFTVKNKYNGELEEVKDSSSGIGLVNVKRRLHLLYDKRHRLSIDDSNGFFNVHLQLNLRES